MAKPVKKPVRKPSAKPRRNSAANPNVLAHRLMRQHSAAHADPMMEPMDFEGQLSAYRSRLEPKRAKKKRAST